MKNVEPILVLLVSWLTTPLHAQVELTITGSTAFRSITIDRAASLYDEGSRTAVTNDAAAGLITFNGTLSNKVAALLGTPVRIRLSFSGSVTGMWAVKNSTPVITAETPGVNAGRVPDLALSDVFPGKATPPIPESSFNRAVLGVVPFLFVRNNALAGVNNITREQTVLLMTASGSIGGINGMSATYLGGTSTNPVYLIGRDPGSGTRINLHEGIGFHGAPLLWATNGAGNYVITNGYSSGALVAQVVTGKPDAIGYLDLADYASISNQATAMAYQGMACSSDTVRTGKYSLWNYDHIVNRAAELSAHQLLVRNALISAITDPAYQSVSPYNDSFVSLSEMQVEKGTDGGSIIPLTF